MRGEKLKERVREREGQREREQIRVKCCCCKWKTNGYKIFVLQLTDVDDLLTETRNGERYFLYSAFRNNFANAIVCIGV